MIEMEAREHSGEQVMEKAITRYGYKAQMIVAIEELSELQKEICKHLRGEENREKLSEEMADAEIMMAQLKIMLSNAGAVETWKGAKLRRLAERMRQQK